MLTITEADAILSQVTFPGYTFDLFGRWDTDAGIVYLQAAFMAPDSTAPGGAPRLQRTRKWLLSQHMTPSEIVQTALLCVLTSVEHEAREQFRYRGQVLFGPHFHIDALAGLAQANRFDVRPSPVSTLEVSP